MADRKRDVVEICLETFMKKGLSETSVRDLSSALNLQSGGLYTYFDGKDHAVIACAEEAAVRIENNLIIMAFKDLEYPELMINNLFERSRQIRPLMQFFVSVCALPKYEAAMHPVLSKLSQRYKHYIEKVSEILMCDTEEVAPYFYMTINTMLNFALFGKESFSAPQMEMTRCALEQFLERRKEKLGSEAESA